MLLDYYFQYQGRERVRGIEREKERDTEYV